MPVHTLQRPEEDVMCAPSLSWHMPLIPALEVRGRGRQLSVVSMVYREFQDSHSYTKKHCLEKQKKKGKKEFSLVLLVLGSVRPLPDFISVRNGLTSLCLMMNL